MPVFGPVTRNGGETVFEKIDSAGKMDIDYITTMRSPRSFIYPSRQELFDIERSAASVRTVSPEQSRVVFGIHPCDMHAVRVLDRTFLGDYRDLYYRKAREETFTVVLNCNRACEKKYPQFMFRGFCDSMGTGPFLRISDGYDMEITVLPDGMFLMEAGSKRAGKLMNRVKGARAAGSADLNAKKALEEKAKGTFIKKLDIKGLPEIMARNTGHPVYRFTADARCLNCTNCTMVCPTCYCYDVDDITSFDLAKTKRSRRWDSCQELNFAKLDGSNLRPSRGARLRQFIFHKLGTWVEQFGCLGCIGCGRCMLWCPTHIDLTGIAKAIRIYDKRRHRPSVAVPAPVTHGPGAGGPENPLLPREAVVEEKTWETDDVFSLRLSVRDRGFSFRPGQFTMLGLPGTGEAPFSFSSMPYGRSFFHTLRVAGNVTRALSRLERGDIVQVRGPLGNGWPLEKALGRDVMIVAGGIGIAPLRPFINLLAKDPGKIRSLTVLYGARSEKDLLFRSDLLEWRASDVCTLLVSCDKGPGKGPLGILQGPVTGGLDRIDLPFGNAVTFLCGPARMMDAAAGRLIGKGHDPREIFVSLHARMKCGIGHCGHCQTGPHFVCKDGPVFPYDVIKHSVDNPFQAK